MRPSYDHRFWLYATIGLLIGQVALLWLSLDLLIRISVFCTAPRSSWLEYFGYVHFLYVGLFILGIAALFQPMGRAIYVVLICVALLALPVQAHLVRNGDLYCDAL